MGPVGTPEKGNDVAKREESALHVERSEADSGRVPADTPRGPAGELTLLGRPKGEFQDSVVGRVRRYLKNIGTAVFKPNQIFCPQKISMARGALNYTLSEDVRVMRAEAYDAGLRRGQASTAKLERYVEGDKAIDIFERGKTYGYNNGFTDGRNERAQCSEASLGTFEDLEEYYNRADGDVYALISKKFVQVFDWDDEISLYARRYGKQAAKEKLLLVVEKILAGEDLRPQLPTAEKIES